jgi:tRNA(Arg) A34 adenosine deaminase TadA
MNYVEISSRNRRYFELAKLEALKSEFPDFKHGAILVKGGSIISKSCNKMNSCSFGARFKTYKGRASLHAELGTILGVPKSKTLSSTIFVVRVSKTGLLANSRPCNMCQGAMQFVGIKKVFYSISDTEYGVMSL